ncbi:MAG TPA: transcription termination/antitermination protein NusG [Bryobacteraceae bacterium]|nr:transcription termination/antitermination protein NusG [Bryobacteraceae bacterium]
MQEFDQLPEDTPEPDAAVDVAETEVHAPRSEAEAIEAEIAEGGPADVVEGEVAEGQAAEGEAELPPDNMQWYIIHTYSGFERKVTESLRTRADAFGFGDQIGQILIPEEEVVELRNGKKVTSKRLLYPGYVVVQMAMRNDDGSSNDELWHRVKDTPRVTGFVGGGQVPVPLSADEINKMLYRQTTAAERPRPKMSFEKNETVRIIDGPFANFQGKVDEINPERSVLKVLVTIFGRATPVELDFLQVEKIA